MLHLLESDRSDDMDGGRADQGGPTARHVGVTGAKPTSLGVSEIRGSKRP